MTVLLDIRQLRIAFDTPQGVLHAVNDLSYTVTEGETLGIVGESGSGKTVQALAIAGLLPSPPARIVSGQILFRGRDLLAMDERQLRAVRGAEIGFVFQDPMTALNPVLTIGRQMTEGLRHHEGLGTSAARQRAMELLEIVGIPDPRGRLDQYPHQFSGGMRQRVMIAIGVACNPRLLIADEATTALDVTVQAQVLDLVADLKKRWGTTVIWITHDMGVVARIADTVQVMYGGRIMERGPAEAIFHDPRSAYTWGLLRALPLAGAGTARIYSSRPLAAAGLSRRLRMLSQAQRTGRQFAEAPAVEQQRRLRGLGVLAVQNLADEDHVVAAFVVRIGLALEGRQAVADERRPLVSLDMRYLGPGLAIRAPELDGELRLRFAQHIHHVALRVEQCRQRVGRLGDAEQHQRRVNRDRVERTDRHSDGLTVAGARTDDRHAGGEASEGLAKLRGLHGGSS